MKVVEQKGLSVPKTLPVTLLSPAGLAGGGNGEDAG